LAKYCGDLDWEPVVGIVGGIALLTLGMLIRSGAFRRWEPWYKNRELPFYIRNLVFAMLPFGVCVLAFMAGALIGERSRGVAGGLVGLAFVAFFVGIAFMLKPPRWLKPDWVRVDENV
jgi:hypothetical protein